MINNIKNKIKQFSKYKFAFLSTILVITIVFSTVVGAEFVGTGTGSNGQYGTSGGTYNLPTPTSHNIPVGYKFSIVYNDGSLHYAPYNYTATIIDTSALKACGSDYNLNKVKYILVDSDGNKAGYNSLSKIAIKRNLSSLTFKTSKLDTATERTNKNVFTDNGTILQNLGLSNANGLFVLPSATTDCDLDSVIKNWQKTKKYVNRVIKLIGSSYCSNNSSLTSVNSFYSGDGLFIEPMWAFNYGGEKMICTASEIALLWGNSSGHKMSKTFHADANYTTSSSGNLAQTFGHRIPNRLYIDSASLVSYRNNFKTVNGSNFVLTGSDKTTWDESSSNRISPNKLINGGYGIALIYSNDNRPIPDDYRLTFRFIKDVTSLDNKYDPIYKEGYSDYEKTDYIAHNEVIVSNVYDRTDESGSIQSQTTKDLTNFGTMLQKADYTKLISENQWVASAKNGSKVLLNQATDYTFTELLNKLGYSLSDTKIEKDSDPGKIIYLRPNVMKATVTVKYRVLNGLSSAKEVASNIYKISDGYTVKAIQKSDGNFAGYVYNDSNYITSTFTPGNNEIYGLYNNSTFNKYFGICYKQFASGDKAYKYYNDILSENKILDEDVQYDAISLLKACGYTGTDDKLAKLKSGENQTITISSRLIDNTGTIYIKAEDDNRPELNNGYSYNTKGVIVGSDNKPVVLVAGNKDVKYTLFKNLNKIIDFSGSNIFKVLEIKHCVLNPYFTSDESIYSVEELLLSTANLSLKKSTNVSGYIKIGLNPITADTKITVKYHVGGVLTDDGKLNMIDTSNFVGSDGYTVNDLGYICKDGKIISNTFSSSETIKVLNTKNLSITNNSYCNLIANSNTPYWWSYKKNDKCNYIDTRTAEYSFDEFYHTYASYGKTTNDGFEVTLYMRWEPFERDLFVYNTELYELDGDTYYPVNTSPLKKSGSVLEEGKRYGIKVVVKHTLGSNIFANKDVVNYTVTVSLGKYTEELKIPIGSTVTINGTFEKGDGGSDCYFLVPYSNGIETYGAYNETESFCDHIKNKNFLNSVFDVSDLIITNKLLNSVVTEAINGPESFNNAIDNNNRFYIDVKVAFSDADINIVDPLLSNNNAMYFMFIKPDIANISTKYKASSDINNKYTYKDGSNKAFAYSGQVLNEMSSFKTNSIYSSYYKIKNNVNLYNTEAEINNDKYLLRNTSNKNFIINSPYTDKDRINVWKSSGTYPYTVVTSRADLVDRVPTDNILYFPEILSTDETYRTVDIAQDATIDTATTEVYPIDFIAPGIKSDVDNIFSNTSHNVNQIKPYVMLYGYDIDGKQHLIVGDLNDLNETQKIGNYESFQIVVRYGLRINTDAFFKNANHSEFDTNIPVDIHFAAFAEKEGEIFSFGSDNFEFSTKDYRDEVDGVDNNCLIIQEKSRYCSYIDDSYIYTLEFTSPKFEFDTYENNTISFSSSISLSDVNLKSKNLSEDENESDNYFDDFNIYENNEIISSTALSEDDMIKRYMSGGAVYSDFKKSFEYNSDNNEAFGNIKFKSNELKIKTSNQTYRKGTKVIVSFDLLNYSEIDYTGTTNDRIVVLGSVVNKFGEEIDVSRGMNFVIPRGISSTEPTKTVCYFEWDIDKTYKAGDYRFKIYHENYSEGISDYLGVINYKIENSKTYNTPDTTFTKTKPNNFDENSKFSYSSIPNVSRNDGKILRNGDVVEWNTYSYNQKALRFEKVNHKLILNISRGNIYNEWDATVNKIASGYGFSALYKVSVKYTKTLYNGDEKISESSSYNTSLSSEYTEVQNVTAFFPEFNYKFMSDEEFNAYISDSFSADIWAEKSGWNNYSNNDQINRAIYGSCATMIKDNKGNYSLPYNTSTLSKTHYLPIWYPDTDYSINFVANDIWTPVGMVSLVSESNSLKVSGTMLDDWHYAGYTYIPNDAEIEYIKKMSGLSE